MVSKVRVYFNFFRLIKKDYYLFIKYYWELGLEIGCCKDLCLNKVSYMIRIKIFSSLEIKVIFLGDYVISFINVGFIIYYYIRRIW